MLTSEQPPAFDVDAYLDDFGVRLVVEALQAATASHWERRAAQLERALPRPGDYPGKASDAERDARTELVRAKVQAARNAATFWRYVHSGVLGVVQ